MADQKKVIRIKAVIDKETDRVLFVESDGDFVDHLLSFMTLPVATIIRLVAEDVAKDVDDQISSQKQGQEDHPSSTIFSCMKNLYSSLQNMEAHYLNTEACKNLLLFPRRRLEPLCMNLKLKIDDKEPTEYFVCKVHSDTIGYGKHLPCNCSDTRRTRITLNRTKLKDGRGVFVKKGTYVVSEGMHVKKGSMDECVSLLRKHGINNLDRLEEKEVDIGVKEVLLLLKCSLFSDTPLTDLILRKGLNKTIKNNNNAKTRQMTGTDHSDGDTTRVTLTVVVGKSNNQVLYVKAKEDFVDFLFSFLTIPLGSAIKLCGGSPSLACLDNLYESIGDLSKNAKVTYIEWEKDLLDQKLLPHHGCGKNQLLSVEEYKYTLNVPALSLLRKLSTMCKKTEPAKITNPKSVNRRETSAGGGYIKGPSSFIVTNDLVVMPLCCTSELFHLRKLKIPINDIEERVVTIGGEEALNLFKASLVTNEALSSISSSNNFQSRTPEERKTQAKLEVEGSKLMGSAQ